MAPQGQRKCDRKSTKSFIAVERTSNNKHKRETKHKGKKLRAPVIENIEELVSGMKIQMNSDRILVMQGEAMAEELQGRITQIREENKQHIEMIVCGQLLADHVQTHYNIFP